MDIAIGHRIKFENPENSTKSIIYDIPGPGQVLELNFDHFCSIFIILASENVRVYTLKTRVHTPSVLVRTPEHVSVLIGNVFIALVSPKIFPRSKFLPKY